MQLSKLFYFYVLKQMVLEELSSFKKLIFDQIINLFIWLTCSLIVMGYLLVAEFNIPADFASFMLAGCVTSAGFFDSYPIIFRLVSDFENEKTISSYLTLPIPSWLVIVKLIIYIALRAAIFSILVLPIGKILIWNTFDLTIISWFKFAISLLFSSIFYGAFAVWVTSMIKNMSMLDHIWIRFVFPLWYLGGFQHSWVTLNKLNAIISYIALLNPMTYIMEATRAALLGQEGYLNFWLCVLAVIIFTFFCSWHALVRIKKRLDYV